MTWRSKWMPRCEKFSVKSDLAFLSRNCTWDGVGSKREEKDALERRGFYDGVDLCLGAIEQTNARKREKRRKKDNQKSTNKIIYQNTKNWRYVCIKMHEHVTCKYKFIIGSAQSNPTSTQHSNKVNTHLKCIKHCYNVHVMQCMII